MFRCAAELLFRPDGADYAVEPNAEMRAKAERMFLGHAQVTSVDGAVEATGLPPHSVDPIAAGQAFHWFDYERAG